MSHVSSIYSPLMMTSLIILCSAVAEYVCSEWKPGAVNLSVWTCCDGALCLQQGFTLTTTAVLEAFPSTVCLFVSIHQCTGHSKQSPAACDGRNTQFTFRHLLSGRKFSCLNFELGPSVSANDFLEALLKWLQENNNGIYGKSPQFAEMC